MKQGGPYPYLRAPLVTKVTEGALIHELVIGEGVSVREASRRLGLSSTTGWRRFWFYLDWSLPAAYGRPLGPVPPQRATRECPRGRPYLPTLDGPW